MKNAKEIKIQVPDGYEIDKEKSTFERIVFKEVKKVLTYDDVAFKLFDNKIAFCTNTSGELVNLNCLSKFCYLDYNNSTTKEQLESILALNKLCNVAKYLNGDWLPNFKDVKENKYCITLDNEKDIMEIAVHQFQVEGGLFFKSRGLAKQAVKILGEEEIRKALTLNH